MLKLRVFHTSEEFEKFQEETPDIGYHSITPVVVYTGAGVNLNPGNVGAGGTITNSSHGYPLKDATSIDFNFSGSSGAPFGNMNLMSQVWTYVVYYDILPKE